MWTFYKYPFEVEWNQFEDPFTLEKIFTVKINLLFYVFFTVVPSNTGKKHTSVGWDDGEKR
jgi:hypothetical protein